TFGPVPRANSKSRIVRPNLGVRKVIAPPAPGPVIGAVKEICAFDALDVSVAEHNVVASWMRCGRHLDKRIETLIDQGAKSVRLRRCVRGREVNLARVGDCVHVTRLLNGAFLRSDGSATAETLVPRKAWENLKFGSNAI